MKKLLLLSMSLCGMYAATAQPMPNHLVGELYFEHDGSMYELSDTTRLVYGPGRMRQMIASLGMWDYDTSYNYGNNGGNIELQGRGVNTYDAAGNITMSEYYQFSGGVYSVMYREIRTYDANRNILSMEFEYNNGSGMEKQQLTTTTYNSNNQPVQALYKMWDAGLMQYIDQNRYNYTYNSSNQLVELLTETFSTGWQPAYRSTYTYVGNNNTELLHEMYNSGWNNISRIENTFDASGRKIFEESQSWNGVWENEYAGAYTYDANGNMLSEEYLNWSGSTYLPNSKQSYSYNSDNYVLTEATSTWNTTAAAYLPEMGDDSAYYHYSNSVSVGKAPVAMYGINVFPSPASTQLHLHMNLAGQQQYTATLYDAAGRVVKHMAGNGAGATRAEMNVRDVPAGNYVLVLNAGATTAREKIVIAR